MSTQELERAETPAEGIDPAQLRQVMSAYPTGITVITAAGPDGPVGMTANSFTSVSLDPPLVLFCAALTSSTWPSIRDAEHFTVNLMSARGRETAQRFATSGIDRYAGVAHHAGVTGSPILSDADSHLECVLESTHVLGDHAVAIGRVVGVGERGTDSPLIFHRSKMHSTEQ
ncbi:flavin reductase family protein [Nocardioides dubius]|uniref:Flavin reductase family protein n=1 Tax=Nocardioides dubius TaxID=317019 RepID=A0ABN1TMN5_9ACTN